MQHSATELTNLMFENKTKTKITMIRPEEMIEKSGTYLVELLIQTPKRIPKIENFYNKSLIVFFFVTRSMIGGYSLTSMLLFVSSVYDRALFLIY